MAQFCRMGKGMNLRQWRSALRRPPVQQCLYLVAWLAIVTAFLCGCDVERRKSDAELGLSPQQAAGRRIIAGQEAQRLAEAVLICNSFWPRRIEHHSLCSAIGMPHSMHTRTRGFGGSFFPNSRFSKDMNPPGSSYSR